MVAQPNIAFMLSLKTIKHFYKSDNWCSLRLLPWRLWMALVFPLFVYWLACFMLWSKVLTWLLVILCCRIIGYKQANMCKCFSFSFDWVCFCCICHHLASVMCSHRVLDLSWKCYNNCLLLQTKCTVFVVICKSTHTCKKGIVSKVSLLSQYQGGMYKTG